MREPLFLTTDSQTALKSLSALMKAGGQVDFVF